MLPAVARGTVPCARANSFACAYAVRKDRSSGWMRREAKGGRRCGIGCDSIPQRPAGQAPYSEPGKNALPCEASMNPAAPAELQSEIARSISREDMAKLPIRRYEGRVCLVATPEDLEEALADLRQESIVGLDTETRPAFRKGESHLPALVQVATARAVYLFQLRRTEVH